MPNVQYLSCTCYGREKASSSFSGFSACWSFRPASLYTYAVPQSASRARLHWLAYRLSCTLKINHRDWTASAVRVQRTRDHVLEFRFSLRVWVRQLSLVVGTRVYCHRFEYPISSNMPAGEFLLVLPRTNPILPDNRVLYMLWHGHGDPNPSSRGNWISWERHCSTNVNRFLELSPVTNAETTVI